MPNPDEVATLVVGGLKFTDWESVWVQHRVAEDAPHFRFTAAERDPVPDQWATLQFKPGDRCAIYLGGLLAIVGVITTRQVAYDANNHGVMLMGKGWTWYAARGSVMNPKLNFDGKTFKQIADEVLGLYGYVPKVIGTLDETPFKTMRGEQGTTVWNFLEGLARTRGIVLGSDHLGNFLLIGKHSYEVDNSLVEGDNILKAQVIIDRQHVYSDYYFRNGAPSTDGMHGASQAHQEAKAASDIVMPFSPLLQVMEHPAWTLAEVQRRAEYEKQWNQGTEVTANITVQGWKQPSGVLWKQGGKYLVKSPMAMLNQALKAKTVTFSQDRQQGTLTMLELVAPWMLNDTSDFYFGPTKSLVTSLEEKLKTVDITQPFPLFPEEL